jgi:hypothetical protein
MQFLLSGFIAALIAALISVVYLYLTEQSRLRSQVAVEVVDYFDDIYTRLQSLSTDKDAAYTGKKRGLTGEEYRITSRELSVLLKRSRIGVRLAIVYGEGDLTGAFNYLTNSCIEVAGILWGATEQNWKENNTKILTLFSERIDPVRKNLERSLLDGTRTHQIINDFFKRLIK